MCACGRWAHEDYIEGDVVLDVNGQERLCPVCISYVIVNSAFCVVGWLVCRYSSNTVASI